MFRLPFLEDTTPPPFYRSELSDKERRELDTWFIGNRSQAYYLKRFDEFDKKGKLYPRWHWAACFATFGWLLYRKRYLDCFVYCVAGLAFVKLTVVLTMVAVEFTLLSHLADNWRWLGRVVSGGLVYGFWAVQVGRWSDAYYYRMARREIADALDKFPKDKAQQQAYLKQHGGVSFVGLSVAYGLFTLVILVVGLQFMPIIASEKEQALNEDVYLLANRVKLQAARSYVADGCPIGMAIKPVHDNVAISITNGEFGRHNKADANADCAVVATVKHARYPIRYLNEQSLVFYHIKGESKWRCQSSLNKQQKIKSC